MHRRLFATLALGSTLPLASSALLRATSQEPAEPPADQEDASALFPAPSEDLVLAIEQGAEAPSLMDLVDRYSELTGQYVHCSKEAQTLLEQRALPFARDLVIPAAEVQSFLEHLLDQERILLTLLREDEPRLLGLHHLSTPDRNDVRAPYFVEADEIERVEHHPALFVYTVVPFQRIDARQVQNYMRILMRDSNFQSMMSIGDSNAMYIQGRGREIAHLVQVLRTAEEHGPLPPEPQPAEAGEGGQ